MQQIKFNIGDTIYFFAVDKQASFVDDLDLVTVDHDPYEKLIKEATVNAIHIYQNKPVQYDTRSSEYGWNNVPEDCAHGSYDEAKTALQELIAKRIKGLTDCYFSK